MIKSLIILFVVGIVIAFIRRINETPTPETRSTRIKDPIAHVEGNLRRIRKERDRNDRSYGISDTPKKKKKKK